MSKSLLPHKEYEIIREFGVLPTTVPTIDPTKVINMPDVFVSPEVNSLS